MEDLIIVHHDKKYLKYSLEKIIEKLKEYKLEINHKKTRIDNIRNGVDFLGYRFFLNNKKIIVRVRHRTKKKYYKKIKDISILFRNNIINYSCFLIGINSYNGMFKWGNYNRLIRERDVVYIIENYYKYKVDSIDYICMFKVGSFYETFESDAYIMNQLFNYKIIKDNNIIDIYNSNNNTYSTYKYDKLKIMSKLIRIDKIIKYIEDNKFNIELETIESVLGLN